jgi:hypothetical protein
VGAEQAWEKSKWNYKLERLRQFHRWHIFFACHVSWERIRIDAMRIAPENTTKMGGDAQVVIELTFISVMFAFIFMAAQKNPVLHIC